MRVHIYLLFHSDTKWLLCQVAMVVYHEVYAVHAGKKLQLPEWLSFRMINNFMALFVISEISNIMSIYWYYTLGIWCLEVNLLRPLHLYRSLSNQRSVIDCLNTEGCHSNNIKKIHKALLHKCCFKLQLKQLIWYSIRCTLTFEVYM